jgi:hypothetical protein
MLRTAAKPQPMVPQASIRSGSIARFWVRIPGDPALGSELAACPVQVASLRLCAIELRLKLANALRKRSELAS